VSAGTLPRWLGLPFCRGWFLGHVGTRKTRHVGM